MKIKIDSTPYEIPTNYADVKWIDFANAHTPNLSLEKKLSYQTGIPPEVIANLQLSALSKIIPVLEFWDTLPEFFEPFETDMNVGNEHYIKLEQSRRHLSNENKWLAAIEIVKIYTSTDISQLPVTQAMGYAAFFLSRLESSSSVTKRSENTSWMRMNMQQE